MLGAGNHQPPTKAIAEGRSILLWPRMTYALLRMEWFRLLVVGARLFLRDPVLDESLHHFEHRLHLSHFALIASFFRRAFSSGMEGRNHGSSQCPSWEMAARIRRQRYPLKYIALA